MNLILIAFSFVCFVIAIFRAGQPDYNKLIAAGLACFAAAQLYGGYIAYHAGH